MERWSPKQEPTRQEQLKRLEENLDSGLILSGAITPASRPEDEAAAGLAGDIAKQGLEIERSTSTAAT